MGKKGQHDDQSDEGTQSKKSGVLVRWDNNVPNHTREFNASDFKRAGVEHGKISVAAGETLMVSEEAAAYLVDELGEFSRVESEEEAQPVDQTSDLSETVPDGETSELAGGGGTQTGANVRDGAGARSVSINR